MLSRDHHGPRAVLNALDRLADSYARPDATPRRQDLAIAEGQLRDYEARLGRPFPHDAYLAELTDLARPAQSRPVAGDARARQRAATGRRAGRADQSPESRPHHRRRPRADRRPPHRRRGAGDRPHPPPCGGLNRGSALPSPPDAAEVILPAIFEPKRHASASRAASDDAGRADVIPIRPRGGSGKNTFQRHDHALDKKEDAAETAPRHATRPTGRESPYGQRKTQNPRIQSGRRSG